MAKIQTTTNYAIFELLPFNRDVRKVNFLTDSMNKHGWIDAYPMHVVKQEQGKLRIKAGHHRFFVAEALRMPVKYVICDDEASIYELEKATTKWTLADYLTSHMRAGIVDYELVREYCDRTGIGLRAAVSMMTGQSAASGNRTEQFKNGTFRVKSTSHAETVARVVNAAEQTGIEYAKTFAFISAVSKIAWAKDFDEGQMKHKIQAHKPTMEQQATIEQYVDLLDEVYNRMCRDRVPLAFQAREAAKSRCAV